MPIENEPEWLGRIALFAELSPEQRDQLLEAVVVRQVQPGDVVLREGQEMGDLFYILASGEFQVSKVSPQGRETILRLITATEAFGLAALFDKGPAPATLTATDAGTLLVVPSWQFLALLEKDFRLTLKILGLLSGRLRDAYQQLHLVASTKARARLARILLHHAERGGMDPVEGGGWRLRTPLPYSVLARIAGISYEETIRILKEWSDLLKYRRGEITLVDPDGLLAIADQE